MSDVSLAVGVGLLCALLSAPGTNLALLFKHRRAVAAPDVDMRHPLRSAIDLFRSKWWSTGWAVAAVAIALHVAALSLAVGVGLLLVFSHLIERIRAQPGVLLGAGAGLGFGISDVAIRALLGDLDRGPIGRLSPWSVIIATAAVFSLLASARSLQIGDGVAVIAVTSVAANLSTILAGPAVFGDRLGNDALVVGVRLAAFTLILVGAAQIPAPVAPARRSTSQPRSLRAVPRAPA